MQKICPTCGEMFPTLYDRKIFCCSQHACQFHRRTTPRTIKNSFMVFKKIVANADNYLEFAEFCQLCVFKEVPK